MPLVPRDRRRWTEWAGAALALMLAVAWAWDELVLRSGPALLIRATVFAGWLAALVVPAWLMAGRLVAGVCVVKVIDGKFADSGPFPTSPP